MSEISILDAARFYVLQGWLVTPLRKGAKHPDTNDWMKGIPEDQLEKSFPLGSNIGIVMGELVDLDLDCIEAVRAAPWVMPATGLKFGRASNPCSHWLYRLSEERLRRTTFYDPDTGDLMLELRGEGHQTMAPPSFHPEGEQVQWVEKTEPLVITIADLEKYAGRCAAMTYIVRHWNEWNGRHHQFIMHLSGGLLRAGWVKEEVSRFVEGVCSIVGDHEPDDRLNAVASTVKRYEDGDTTTGWASIIDDFMVEKSVNDVRRWLGGSNDGQDFSFSDDGNALRMAHHFGDVIRFSPQLNRWLIFDGRRWEKDIIDTRIMGLVRETIDRCVEETERISDPERRAHVMKWFNHSRMRQRMEAVPKLARSIQPLVAMAFEFDQRHFLLNVSNGTLNIETGGLQPFNKAEMLTTMADVRYQAGSVCPGWDAFIERALPDVDTRRYVQKAAGYTLSGSNKEQCLFIAVGRSATGKSTFINIIRTILGDYAKVADVSSFVQSRNSERPRQDLARLAGARMVATGEAEEGQKFSENTIKTTTGGDLLTVRYLYGQEFEYEPVFKIWMGTNERPKIRSTDDAMWRRMRVIPFEQHIPKAERILDLSDRILRTEKSGILNWMLRGFQLWQQEGLGESTVMEQAVEEYKADSDSVRRFLAEEVEKERDVDTPSADVFGAYRNWCEENGERPVSSNLFKGRVEAAGFENKRTKHGVVWLNLALHRTNTFTVVVPPSNPFGPS